jgi:hypothetical protein
MSCHGHQGAVAAFAALILMLGGDASVAAEEEKKLGWSDVAEFSWVATSGNSETETIGFKNKLLRRWEHSAFELNVGGIQAENTTVTEIFAVGPDQNNFTVTRETETKKTAENYYLNGKYGKTITERFFWYAGAGWDRNEFAGIRNRYTGSGGVGNLWVDKEKVLWRTDYGVSYTDQQDVVKNPNVDETFAGIRISSTYKQQFGATTTYGNDTILDENLSDTEDFRANMTNWVTVGISDNLALKVSLQWLFDNLPSFEEIDFFLPGNMPPAARNGTVFVPLEDLDTIFMTSLVVNF